MINCGPRRAIRFVSVPAIRIVSIPYGSLPEFGNRYASQLSGKIVMETGNPCPERDGDVAKRVLDSGLGTGHWSACWLPGARLVRAFNSVWDRTLALEAYRDPPRVGVPVAADDMEAREIAATTATCPVRRRAGLSACRGPERPPSIGANRALLGAEALPWIAPAFGAAPCKYYLAGVL